MKRLYTTRDTVILVSLLLIFSLRGHTQSTGAIIGEIDVCQKSSISYSTTPDMTNYVWSVTGGVIRGGQGTSSASIYWNSDGTHLVYVNFVNNENITEYHEVSVNVKVSFYGGPINGPSPICGGVPAFYFASPNNNNYNWTYPPGYPSISTEATAKLVSTPTSLNSISLEWSPSLSTSPPPSQLIVTYTNADNLCFTQNISVMVMKNPPTPIISNGPAYVCYPDNNEYWYFTGSGYSNYTWNVSGGITTSQSGNGIKIKWDTPGTHELSVNYSDYQGCYAIEPGKKIVTVTPTPSPLTVTGPTSACAGTVVVYSTTPGMPNYNWVISNGGTITTGYGTNSISVLWNNGGSKQVSVNYYVNNCFSSLSPLAVTVDGASIIGPNYGCTSSTSVYTTESGMSNYIWDVSGGTIISNNGTNQVTIKWAPTPGNGTISLIYTGQNNGCDFSTPVTKSLVINPSPVPYISNPTGLTQVCQGQVLPYSTAPPSQFPNIFRMDYQWQVSDGNVVITNPNPTQRNMVNVSWNIPGEQVLSVNYLENPGGCYASTPAIFSINVLPAPEITVTPESPTTFCLGGSVKLNATIGANYSYQWYRNNNPISGATSSFYSSIESGNFMVRVTNSVTGCTKISPQIAITVNPNPAITLEPMQAVCIGTTNSLIYYTSPTGSPNQYRIGWDAMTDVPWTTLPASPIPISGLPTTSGVYGGTLYVKNITTGCESAGIPISIMVKSVPDATFSGLNGTYCTNVSTVALTPATTGGSFSGTGISANTFSPTVAGPGTHTITYNVTVNGCANSSSQQVTVNALPNASFTGLSSAFCTNTSSVTLTPAVIGGSFSGPGISGNTFNPSTAGTGTHTIIYNVTINGCANSSSQQVTVNALPNASFSGMSSSYCSNAYGVTLIPTTAGGNFSGPGISGSTFSPSTAGTGIHIITYTVTINGCVNSSSQQVTVNALPNATFSGMSSAYCSNAYGVTLSPVMDGGSFSGPGVLSNIFYPSVAGEGIHTITYTIAVNGCANYSSQQVAVESVPTASITPVGPIAFCNGGSIVLNTTANSNFSYQWFLNDATISGANFSSYTATSQGRYVVKITTNKGCSATSPFVRIDEAAPIVSIVPASSTTFCQGNSVLLNISWTEIAISSYQWKRDGINILGATSEYYYAAQSGNYTITLTPGNSTCAYTTPPVTVTVLSAPQPYITTSFGLCTYGYVKLTANGSTGASSYTWSTGATTTVSSINVYESGSYNVRANYSNGCSATSYNIIIKPCRPPNPCDPYARVPIPCIQTAIDQTTEIEVTEPTAYPNPANHEITLHLPFASDVDSPVKLYSQVGVLHASAWLLKGSKKVIIDTRELTNGIYIIQLESPQGKPLIRKKVLVVHP